MASKLAVKKKLSKKRKCVILNDHKGSRAGGRAAQLQGATLEWIGWNPKVPNSKAYERFERYRGARTLEEFQSLGGLLVDLNHDVQKGFVWGATNSKRQRADVSNVLKRPAGRSLHTGPLVVACLGDSNTKARGSESWPEQLQQLLAASAGPGAYRVRAFGVGGSHAAATSGSGVRHYQALPKCSQALACCADVYVVMLGTNDAWHLKGDPHGVAGGLSDLLEALSLQRPASSHKRKPEMILVLPPGTKPGRLANNLKSIVHPSICQLARERHGVRLASPLLPSNTTVYKDDLVHLTARGAFRIAQAVARVILP